MIESIGTLFIGFDAASKQVLPGRGVKREEIQFWLDIFASTTSVLALGGIALEFRRAIRADTVDFLYTSLEIASAFEDERQIVESRAFSEVR